MDRTCIATFKKILLMIIYIYQRRNTCINYSNLILNINDLFIFQISENIAKLLQLPSLTLTYTRIHEKSKNPVFKCVNKK